MVEKVKEELIDICLDNPVGSLIEATIQLGVEK